MDQSIRNRPEDLAVIANSIQQKFETSIQSINDISEMKTGGYWQASTGKHRMKIWRLQIWIKLSNPENRNTK
jgi:hypothetical protein